MKIFLSLVTLIMISMSINAQNKIENDELFIKYKEEYKKNLIDNQIAQQLEMKSQAFYKKIKTDVKRDFYKSKSKEKWLKKNISKTGFRTLQEAEYAYIELKRIQEENDSKTSVTLELYNELLNKYNREDIYQAVKDYIWTVNNSN